MNERVIYAIKNANMIARLSAWKTDPKIALRSDKEPAAKVPPCHTLVVYHLSPLESTCVAVLRPTVDTAALMAVTHLQS